MSQQEEIVLWIDQRWKRAIEKHLNDETLQEHLENVLDELCNQLPEREYERISRAIQSEAAAQRAEEEAARTYAAYHVTEHGQEWYFKTSPGAVDGREKAAQLHHQRESCCAGFVYQNVCRRSSHHCGGIQCADRCTHGEHRKGMRCVRCELRQA